MRIPVEKFQGAPELVRTGLLRIQDAINKALGWLPFDYAQRIDFRFYSTDLPKVVFHNMPKPAWGLHHVYLRNLTTDATVPAQAVHIDWIPDGGGVRIRSISGLTAAQLYEMRLIVYG